MFWVLLGGATIAAVAVTTLRAKRTKARALPPWLQHAVALGFRHDTSFSPARAKRDSAPRCEISGPSVKDPGKVVILVVLARPLAFSIDAETGAGNRDEGADHDGAFSVKPWLAWGADQKRIRSLLEAIEPTAVALGRTYALRIATQQTFIGQRPAGERTTAVAVLADDPIDRDGLRAAIAAAERLAARVERARASSSERDAPEQRSRLGELTWSDGWYRGALDGPLGRRVTVLFQNRHDTDVLAPEQHARVETFVTTALAAPAMIRSATAAQLLEEYPVWFEDEPIERGVLADQLALQLVSVPPDFKDLTLSFSHPALSGHVAEVVLSPEGQVTHVGLLG